MHSFRAVAALLLACILASCGGGGGGGGSGSGGGNDPPRGAFTLAATSANFAVAYQGSNAPSQEFALNITGRDVAFAGAAYLTGQTPASWLSIEMPGSGASYKLRINVSNFQPPGQYTTTFAVGTADASGNVLQQKNFTVNLTVFAHLSISNLNVINRSFIFGDADHTFPIPLTVQGPDRPWSLYSNVPWIQVPGTSQTGSATATGMIDISGLAPGIYNGIIGARDNADSSNGSGEQVTVVVTDPAFTAAQQSLLFGGENGEDALLPLPVNFNLATGAGVHPFTATVHTDSDGGWLQVSNPMGTVGAAGATVNLSVTPGGLDGATRTAQLTLAADVLGRQYTITVPVTWNHEWNRLVTSAAGVSFSSLPDRSVLTRTLKVFAPGNHAGTPWTAQSDQSWLSVTPAGTTNGNLTLTADPSGLAVNTTHFANVSVTSTAPLVRNAQSVRVGLYISDSTPAIVSFARTAAYMAASPVEPLVAVSGGGSTDVSLYNVYTGALARTLAGVAAAPATVKFSGDGTRLFVYDSTNLNVRELNAVSGAQLASYDATSIDDYYRNGTAMDVLRPGGDELLITPGGRVYDTADGHYHANATFFPAVIGRSIDHSPDQGLVSPEFGYLSSFRRTALRGGGLEIKYLGSLAGSDGAEGCFNPAGTRFYAPWTNGGQQIIAGSLLSTQQVVQQLPTGLWPSSVRCGWNDLIVAGSEYPDNNSQNDINVFYGPTGVNRMNMRAAIGGVYGVRLIRRGLEFSGDGTRLIAIYSNSIVVNAGDGVTIQDLPTPQ